MAGAAAVALLLSASLLAPPPAQALQNGAAAVPPMGWSSWNAFHCNINGSLLLDVGDALKSSGMLAAGYASVNIDDCWPLRQRDTSGNIVADPQKFPQGMDGFSKELRAKGIGLGIYTAHGNLTCQRFPGSLGHETQDAALYKEWGVVFVKNDWCWHNEPSQSAHLDAFNAMRDALNATGVPMVHSIHWNYADTPGPGCDRGVDCPLPETANMWRIGGDIGPNWGSVLRLIDINTGHGAGAAPGAWNDMDMLEVGNGMTADQDRGHFTMWCIMASPLIAGNDLRKMSADTAKILTNPHAIKVNQDKLGKQATLLANTSATQVWIKPLADPPGSWAVALLNRGSAMANIELSFANMPASAPHATAYEVFDLWDDGKSLGVKKGSVAATVPGTAAAFYKMMPGTY